MPELTASRELVAQALLDAGTVTLRPDEPVTFKSGLRSPVYVDNRRLIFQPGPWRVVIEAFPAELRSERWRGCRGRRRECRHPTQQRPGVRRRLAVGLRAQGGQGVMGWAGASRAAT